MGLDISFVQLAILSGQHLKKSASCHAMRLITNYAAVCDELSVTAKNNSSKKRNSFRLIPAYW
jgi:hypothetical protein